MLLGTFNIVVRVPWGMLGVTIGIRFFVCPTRSFGYLHSLISPTTVVLMPTARAEVTEKSSRTLFRGLRGVTEIESKKYVQQ